MTLSMVIKVYSAPRGLSSLKMILKQLGKQNYLFHRIIRTCMLRFCKIVLNTSLDTKAAWVELSEEST